MGALNVLVILRAKAGKEAELRRNLVALVEPSRQEPGNVRYDLFEDAQAGGRFVFLETWADPAAQQKHHNEGPHIRDFHANGDADVESRELILVLERLV